jgi:DNA mismatch endonuclease (patch repair protein)
MRAVRLTGTDPELQLHTCLKQLGLRFRVHASLNGTRCRPDFVIARQKVAIFVDGCFWHGCPKHATWPSANAKWWRSKIEENRKRDKRSRAALRHAGWRVLRVWEHEDPHHAALRIAGLLRLLP